LGSGDDEYDDCSSCIVEGPGAAVGSEAWVCFIADEVAYTGIVTG
jgi:hypothetical protein